MRDRQGQRPGGRPGAARRVRTERRGHSPRRGLVLSGPAGDTRPARLLISCADGPGIVAAVSSFLFEAGANIVASDQFSTHHHDGTFFMRVEFVADGTAREAIAAGFEEVAAPHGMNWRISAVARRRVALMASREDHCLLDLLWRQRRGELDMSVECVISNHEVLRDEVEQLGVDFLYIPVSKATKRDAERDALARLAGRVELVVLARYMQVLSADFLNRVGCPVINIHHSFLPAFAGADPYRQAWERGVKLIGATAHYASAELDQGPIIAQDSERVGHTFSVEDLRRLGRDLERVVLARAVASELADRVIVHDGRTIVF